MERRNMVIFGVIVGFFLGFLVAWGIFSDSQENKPVELDEQEVTEQKEDEGAQEAGRSVFDRAPTLVAENNIVHVKDQKAGGEVFLSRVELTQNGWVAIREVHSEGVGNILGAKRFDIGVHQDTVMLLRETVAGNKYQVVLYADNGDKNFDFTVDPLVTNRVGEPISMSFEAY